MKITNKREQRPYPFEALPNVSRSHEENLRVAKKLIFTIVASFLLLTTGCEKFLDTSNYTKKDTSNWPTTVSDAEQLLAGVYTTLNTSMAYPYSTWFYVAMLASDDCLGGGGEHDYLMQALDLFMNYGPDMLTEFWESRYTGIFRANMGIETLDNCTGWSSAAQRNQMMGELYFMRAFFYFEMVSLFGQVPLVITTEAVNLPKAEPEELYAQITSDLKNAIELMYSQPYTVVEAGHSTKWAAQALMARVFLFYTGYYGKSELPLTDGGTVAKAQVATWLEECINNSGHSLVPDFRNIWSYTNKYTVEDYEYTKGLGLKWVEDDGATNPETLFSIKFSNFASWETTVGYANQYITHFSLRGGQEYAKTFPWGQGWGAGPVNPKLWNDWGTAEPNDMRRRASIIDIPNEIPEYTYGGWADFVQETDYAMKKLTHVTAYNETRSSIVSDYSVVMYGSLDDMQLSSTQDLILIRLADVYLMHSELTETADYLNKVRNRAGLPNTTYSQQNLQNERRWELAFEGIRYNDLRRWGIAGDVLETQTGVSCYNKGNPDVNKSFGGGYKARYAETGGFFAIPVKEIALSEGVLVQNKGWGMSASEYTGWK